MRLFRFPGLHVCRSGSRARKNTRTSTHTHTRLFEKLFFFSFPHQQQFRFLTFPPLPTLSALLCSFDFTLKQFELLLLKRSFIPTRMITTAETNTSCIDEREEAIDFAQLHPSVRFYQGMWKLTQLSDDDGDDNDGDDGACLPPSPTAERNICSQDPPPPTSAATSSFSAKRKAPTRRTSPLSVVALHQRLLPPAPVNGLGEVADESYAAQLASRHGIEFLRRHWHLLLPLLFPCCSDAHVHTEEEEAGARVRLNRGDAMPHAGSEQQEQQQEGKHNGSSVEGHCTEAAQRTDNTAGNDGDMNGAAAVAPESTWSAQELYCQLQQRPLSATDLKVIREPGHMDRIYYSYIVLLRFFGWRVHDEERGLLDRNRAWAERYAMLEMFRAHRTQQAEMTPCSALSPPLQMPPSPTYAAFNFYEDGLPRVLRGLLDVGFLRLAVRLVEFVMEEIKCDRLLFLLPLVEGTLLPLVVEHANVEPSHKTRLKKQLYRLTHSDSD